MTHFFGSRNKVDNDNQFLTYTLVDYIQVMTYMEGKVTLSTDAGSPFKRKVQIDYNFLFLWQKWDYSKIMN